MSGGRVAALLHSDWVTHEPFLAEAVRLLPVAYLVPSPFQRPVDRPGACAVSEDRAVGGKVVWAAHTQSQTRRLAPPVDPRRKSLGNWALRKFLGSQVGEKAKFKNWLFFLIPKKPLLCVLATAPIFTMRKPHRTNRNGQTLRKIHVESRAQSR